MQPNIRIELAVSPAFNIALIVGHAVLALTVFLFPFPLFVQIITCLVMAAFAAWYRFKAERDHQGTLLVRGGDWYLGQAGTLYLLDPPGLLARTASWLVVSVHSVDGGSRRTLYLSSSLCGERDFRALCRTFFR